ncbi:transcriptional regulator [Ancylomarina longa]|uniref:Transcriptional regulator n=2 Tax=Ancylomarina longa TaxID=2487017 RepID=A0A434AXD0_9BACT|nr:transcriptional regulator [Ancylomarina longa]
MSARYEKYGICPVNATLNLIGGKWKTRILYLISSDVNRFGQILKLNPECSKRILTVNLRELEADGVINRKVYPVVPPKVIYSLTELGETLHPLFNSMSEWGMKHILEPQFEK